MSSTTEQTGKFSESSRLLARWLVLLHNLYRAKTEFSDEVDLYRLISADVPQLFAVDIFRQDLALAYFKLFLRGRD